MTNKGKPENHDEVTFRHTSHKKHHSALSGCLARSHRFFLIKNEKEDQRAHGERGDKSSKHLASHPGTQALKLKAAQIVLWERAGGARCPVCGLNPRFEKPRRFNTDSGDAAENKANLYPPRCGLSSQPLSPPQTSDAPRRVCAAEAVTTKCSRKCVPLNNKTRAGD